MAPSSSTFLDRLPFSRQSPLLPLHKRNETDYDLEELEPKPTDGLLSTADSKLHRRKPRRDSPDRIPESIRDADEEQTRRHVAHPALFDKPPPPIARSMLLSGNNSSGSSPPPRRTQQQTGGHSNVASSLLNIGSVFFDSQPVRQQPQHQPAPDSIWQNLRRRENVLIGELQRGLDMQAAALASELLGSGSSQLGKKGLDGDSDAGSSTPTATFYSTASSRSKMINSLNLPTRSTRDGNIIPVRQPNKSKRPGIRRARNALLQSMIAMADFKAEEDARISAAISQRKMALARLRKLAASRQTIRSELQALDEDEEEPLGKELNDLHSQRTSLTDEIKQLEERLIGLRNKRRWVDSRIDDVRNRREAGLSGYKGALKEVEADIDDFVRRPSIKPLDRELWESEHGESSQPGDATGSSPGGEEFLRLIPERRTLDMARSWWEAEILLLENRRREIDRDRVALESGERLWAEVINLVTDYETSIVDLMKGGSSTRKGKEKVPSPNDMARRLLEQMSTVIGPLEEKLKTSEDNQWNLLICAIGAELDSFEEAERVLRQSLTPRENESISQAGSAEDVDAYSAMTESPVFKPSLTRGNSAQSKESDNEVPQDLFAPPDVDPPEETPKAVSPVRSTPSPREFERSDSENSVPPEFLAEHSDVVA